MSDQLQVELETYEKHKTELLANSRGKYVLIKGEQVVGAFDSQADAANEGYRLFGGSPFLVKQVLDQDLPMNFTSFKIAI